MYVTRFPMMMGLFCYGDESFSVMVIFFTYIDSAEFGIESGDNFSDGNIEPDKIALGRRAGK